MEQILKILNLVCWSDSQDVHRSNRDLDSSRASRITVRALPFSYNPPKKIEDININIVCI